MRCRYGFLVSLFLFVLLSCSSVPLKGRRSALLPLPQRENEEFFSKIPPNIMVDVEHASPVSLYRAVSQIRKSRGDYTEAEQVLLVVCAGIMEIAYPTEQINWAVPEVSVRTPYTSAIESAQNGVYDSSAGDIDFLTMVLPSLILLTTTQPRQYFDRSEAALINALSSNPESVLANYLLGTLYQRQGWDDMAIPFLEKAYSLETSCLQTGVALAMGYCKNNRFTEAERISKSLYERFPRNNTVLKLCATTQYELGNFPAASSFTDLVLQREPGSSEYMLLRANLFVLEGNYIRAISLLDIYAKSDQQARDYLLLRARIQHNWNKNNAAASSFIEQALTLYPDDSMVFLTAAELSSETGQSIHGVSAENFALRVLENEPGNMKAHSILVSEAASRRNWAEAYRHSSEMLAFDDVTPEIVEVHIHICLMLSQQEEARQYAEELYRNYPAREDVIRSYIEMLVSTRDREAPAHIETYLPEARADMRSFLFCEQSKLRTREADKLDDLRKSLTANPQNLDALFEFYLLYFGKKDYRKASYYLKQIVALNPNDEYMRQLNAELDSLIS